MYMYEAFHIEMPVTRLFLLSRYHLSLSVAGKPGEKERERERERYVRTESRGTPLSRLMGDHREGMDDETKR